MQDNILCQLCKAKEQETRISTDHRSVFTKDTSLKLLFTIVDLKDFHVSPAQDFDGEY